MNINDFINKLFKRHKELNLISLNELEAIPSRNDLNDDKLSTLDNYKNNYISLLSKRKYLTSHDISATDFTDDMLMNFTLFGNIVINDDNIHNLDTMKDYEKKDLWLKSRVNPLKIELYVNEMEKLYTEVLLRLIALKEIYAELGNTLPKNKQDALLNEIYNLTSSYIILKNNFFSALVEIKNYHNTLTNSEDIRKYYGDINMNHFFKNRISNTIKYARLLIPDALDNLEYLGKFNQIESLSKDLKLADKTFGTNYDVLAYLERELEIYAYNNLRIDELNQELVDIDQIEKVPSNRLMLIKRISDLEIKYRVLNEYGLRELDLKPLYEVMFDILTIDLINLEDSPFRYYRNDDIANNYFEDILRNRIVTNITGADSALSNMLGEVSLPIINDMAVILKDINYLAGKLEYDYSKLLYDKFRLSLIISTASAEQIKYLFNNYQINLHSENIITTNYIFATQRFTNNDLCLFTDFISLSTACRIICFYNEIGRGKNKLRAIIELYKHFLGNLHINNNYYKLPIGVQEINTVWLSDAEETKTRNYFIPKISDKTLIMPNTLKSLTITDVLNGISIPKIVLNEGLETLDGKILKVFKDVKSITIPSTLNDIDLEFLENSTNNSSAALEDSMIFNFDDSTSLKEIIFTNFEDSVILRDTNARHNMLCSLFNMLKSNLEHNMIFFGYIWRHQKYKNNQFEISNDMYYAVRFFIKMQIILSDKNNQKCVINLGDIFSDILSTSVNDSQATFVLVAEKQIDNAFAHYTNKITVSKK